MIGKTDGTVGFVILLTLFGNTVTLASIECEADYNCPDDHYCYMAGHCVPCITCSDYNRINSSSFKCPQKPAMCGNCLSGYEEELLTQGEIRDICIKSPVTDKNEQPEESPKGFMPYYLMVGFGMVFSLTMYVLCWKPYSLKRNSERRSVTSEDVELAPPPYTEICENQNEVEEVSEPLVHEMHVSREKVALQQAVPFREAYLDSSENIRTEIAEPETGSHPQAEEEHNDFLIDENTMPSDWTPERPAEEATTSFVETTVTESQVPSNSEEPRPKEMRRDNMYNVNNVIDVKINNFFNINNSQS